MRYSASREIDMDVKKHVRQGWLFTRGKKHGKLRHPNGQVTLTVPKTPSDWRAALNFHRDLCHAISRYG